MNDSQLPVPAPSKEVRQWAMLCHFAAFLGLVFPFGSLLGPLILWQFKKDMDPLVDDQGKEALNFQITLLIVYVVGTILTVILIGALINLVAWLTCIVLSIMAALKVNEGVAYRYPFALRLIK